MTAIYSKRLVGPVAVGTSALVVGTVPVGKTWVVKQLLWINQNFVGSIDVGLYIGAAATTNQIWRRTIGTGAAIDVEQLSIALASGDVLRAVITTTGTSTLTLSGYEFT